LASKKARWGEDGGEKSNGIKAQTTRSILSEPYKNWIWKKLRDRVVFI